MVISDRSYGQPSHRFWATSASAAGHKSRSASSGVGAVSSVTTVSIQSDSRTSWHRMRALRRYCIGADAAMTGILDLHQISTDNDPPFESPAHILGPLLIGD